MAAAHSSVPAWMDPMLAKPDGGRLREGPQWAYEYKLDGYRVAMGIAADGTTVLTSRNGLDLTAEFAELTGVLTATLRGRAAVLDAFNVSRMISRSAILVSTSASLAVARTWSPGLPCRCVPRSSSSATSSRVKPSR